MMKRLLTILSAALTAGAVSAAAPQQLIDIRTDDVSIVLSARPDGEVHFRHFGSRIDDPSPLADYKSSRRADHGTDDLACPVMGGRNFREPALRITHADGDMNTDLRYVSHSSRQLADPNVTETVVKMTDCCQALDVELVFTAYARENVITTHTVIRNREEGPVTLHSFYSSAVTLKSDKYLLTHLYGAWAREAQVDHTLLTHGSKSIESMREVRTTHTENPAFMLTLGSGSFSENCGEVIAGALAWSGNFRLNFEVDEYDVLTVLAGANPNGSEYRLRPGESFTTPEMIYTHSLRGAGGASRNLHDWGRNYGVYHAERVVPTLLNSWEGAYFDFDAKVLKQMIDDAASMGLEMFVLDDGWFGNKYPRKDDHAGLGDWEATKSKLPGGIPALVKSAKEAGVKFGLWIEPEMVNPKSELYEKHKNWVIEQPNRQTYYYRNQLVLDLSNPEVQNYVFGIVDKLMTENPNIAYFKWDCNSPITNIYSPYEKAQQGNMYIDHVRGLYKILDRIHAKYPKLEMMLCSGGGARCDYTALKYFGELWPSDNTDPFERLYIQWSMSKFFPVKAIAAHVTNWNKATSVKFCTDVASMCKLGFDIDLKTMDKADYAYTQGAVANWRRLEDVILNGELYRLVSPYESNHAAVNYVSQDKSKGVVFAYDLHPRTQEPVRNVKLQGLDANRMYTVKEINLMPDTKSALDCDGQQYSGDFLMKVGLNILTPNTATSHVLELTAE